MVLLRGVAVMNIKENITFEFPAMQPGQRLQELILYIADRLQGDDTFGKVKLAKVLYFADFASYRMYKQPVTGSAYIRWQYGPVPQNYLDILDEMETNGYIAIKKKLHYRHEQTRIIALRNADLTMFSGRDIQLVEDLIRDFAGKNATELSQLSHGIAWKLPKPDEKIPYETSLLSDEPLTQSEIDHAMQLAREYGLE
jgi:uncharacterized phage-associated protein